MARSTAITLNGGTSSHCEMACIEIPSGSASLAKPPTASIARRRASFLSLIVDNSSIALDQSQALLHCVGKAMLYHVEMTLGKRIAAARARFEPEMTQKKLADEMEVSEQAVSQWEKGKDNPGIKRLPRLARALKVPVLWLLEGGNTPPDENDPAVQLETLSPADRKAVGAFMQHLRQHGRRTG